MAGADITEFGKPPLSPGCGRRFSGENSMKPVVAANPWQLPWGGLENALAATTVLQCESAGGLRRSNSAFSGGAEISVAATHGDDAALAMTFRGIHPGGEGRKNGGGVDRQNYRKRI